MADFIWVTALRVLGSLAVLVAPLPGLWFNGHLDRWDWSLLGMPSASAHEQQVYQHWDKSIDTFTLAIALVVALGWKDPIVRRLAIAAAAWRVAGVAVFMVTDDRALFVLFPSVFEKLFLFYLLFRVFARQDIMLRTWTDAAVVMVALTLPKMAEEYFIHVAGRPWQTMTLLPASITTPDREYWVWMPIMLALPALAMIRVVLQSREAPAAEKIPLLTALLGRQTSPASRLDRPALDGPRFGWRPRVPGKTVGA
jgi:hypothetical protein